MTYFSILLYPRLFQFIIITESSTDKATFIEIKFVNVSIGYTANSMSTTYPIETLANFISIKVALPVELSVIII